MYHISKAQIVKRLNDQRDEWSKRVFPTLWMLKAMEENIGVLYHEFSTSRDVDHNGRFDQSKGYMVGLIDEETCLVIPWSEYREAIERRRDEIRIITTVIEGDEDDEHRSLVFSQVNPFESVFTWLGDRP